MLKGRSAIFDFDFSRLSDGYEQRRIDLFEPFARFLAAAA
jgi:hypothetical protein